MGRLNATVARLRLGDGSAASDYVEIVRELEKEVGFFEPDQFFAPLLLFPDDPELTRFSEELFGSTDSSWHPKNAWFGLSSREIASWMLANGPYREAIIGLLDDTSVVGEVWLKGTGLKYEFAESQGSGGHGPIDEQLLTQHDVLPGRTELRVCDAVAFNLSSLEGAPAFLPVWTTETRDAIICEIAKFVKTNSHLILEIVNRDRFRPGTDWMTNDPIIRK